MTDQTTIRGKTWIRKRRDRFTARPYVYLTVLRLLQQRRQRVEIVSRKDDASALATRRRNAVRRGRTVLRKRRALEYLKRLRSDRADLKRRLTQRLFGKFLVGQRRENV